MSGHDETPPVGSLAEEAVKLLDALKSWADETGIVGDADTRTGTGQDASILAQINEHIATGGQDCTYCPICRLIALGRATSPEVRHHLGVAASSALQAASALLATSSHPGRTADPGVEHIDLSDEWEDD